MNQADNRQTIVLVTCYSASKHYTTSSSSASQVVVCTYHFAPCIFGDLAAAADSGADVTNVTVLCTGSSGKSRLTAKQVELLTKLGIKIEST